MRVMVALAVVLASAMIGGGVHTILSAEAQEADDPEWPPLEDARIRPGVQITADGHGWCTSNFVFTDDDGGIYLGTAGHCVDRSIGAPVRLQQDPDFFTGKTGPVIGTVHYSSRVYENVWSESCFVILSCSAGPGNSANDFALIKIDEAWHDEIHPAVLHFGGPTGLAAPNQVFVNDRVLTYGNSPLRPGPTPLDWREGFISSTDRPWTIRACIVTPGVPGDSGSNTLLGDGRALGVVVTLGVGTPCVATNGITLLHTALGFARDRGYPVELATWQTLNGGVLP